MCREDCRLQELRNSLCVLSIAGMMQKGLPEDLESNNCSISPWLKHTLAQVLYREAPCMCCKDVLHRHCWGLGRVMFKERVGSSSYVPGAQLFCRNLSSLHKTGLSGVCFSYEVRILYKGLRSHCWEENSQPSIKPPNKSLQLYVSWCPLKLIREECTQPREVCVIHWKDKHLRVYKILKQEDMIVKLWKGFAGDTLFSSPMDQHGKGKIARAVNVWRLSIRSSQGG